MSSPSPISPRRSLYLVTDRRRLGEVLGRPPAAWRSLLLQQIEGAIGGGVDFVQIRERDLDANALVALVRDVVRLTRRSGTRVIVNDRTDVAVAAGADGVHLREASVAARDVRRLSKELLVGRSVHSTRLLDPDVDYAIAGTVFPTESKGYGDTLGLDGLAAAVRALSPTPVFAIGGVSEERLVSIARAGAAGAAAIGLFLPPRPTTNIASEVQKRVKQLRFIFDSASAVS